MSINQHLLTSIALMSELIKRDNKEEHIFPVTKPRESGNGWKPNYIRQSAAAYHKAARQASLDLKKGGYIKSK